LVQYGDTMPKIALINPPSSFLIDDKVFPPLGILYISAYLKKYGYYPEIIDLAGNKKLPNIDADIIGISAVTPQYPEALKILHELKNRGTNAIFVIGGPHATCSPETAKDFDISVIGEGENAMLNIAMRYPTTFPKYFKYPPPNLYMLPFPDRKNIDIHNYKYFIDDEPTTTMLTSRGCPYNCAFCSSIYNRVRLHSADYVINEIKEIQKLNFSGIMFFDDIFILNKKRLFKICEYLKKEKIVWRCFVRADLVNDEIMKIMAKSGCKEIGIGVETGSQKILDIVNKGTTVEQNTKTIELARNYGILSKAFIIVGLPSESKETIAETEQFLKKTKPDDLDITIYVPYPNTPIVNNPNRYDIKFDKTDLKKAWFKGIPGQYHSLVSTSNLPSYEIVEARDKIEKKFKEW